MASTSHQESIRTFIMVMYVCGLAAGQLMMEELQEFNIDPLNLNGTEPYTDLTIDQIIARASGGLGMAQNLMNSEDGTILAELDMRLTSEQFFNLYEQPSNYEENIPRQRRSKSGRKLERHRRKAIRDVVLRWDDGVIPYTFVNGHFSEKEKYMIRTAMTEWEKYTCLRFRPSGRGDRNLVRFQNGLGCNSQLGMVGGSQPLNLDKNGCRFKGLYLHEIGHAIGLVHEHQLPNRDEYIEILYQNVEPSMRIWFNKYSSQEVDQMKVPYEYSSVMHYGITAFAADGKSQTIRSKQTDKEKNIGRVYRKELSFTDVKIVNLMYQCAKKCDSSIVCRNGGYIDQNCKCICPDGTDACTKDKDEPQDRTCFNAHGDDWQCAIWANQGECDRNPRYMTESCKRACKLCGDKSKDDATCEDHYETKLCRVWKDHGECIVNNKWMHKYCRQTCNACENSGPDPDVACDNKHTDEAECHKWAAEGECQMNPAWMPENCKKSCHMCGEQTPIFTTTETPKPGDCENFHNTPECEGWAETGECSANPDWMIPNCRRACNKCDEGGQQECKNTWDDDQCSAWARDKECIKNSVWMNTNCHRSCTGCGGGSTEAPRPTQSPVRTTTTSSGDCVNNHRSDEECVTWAQYGHCDINPWMKIHCAKSCKTCTAPEVKTTTTAKPDNGGGGGGGGGGGDNTSGCEDKEQYCPSWAQHGFCEDNPNTALRICKKSCKACNAARTCKDGHALCPVWARGGQCTKNSGYMLRSCQKSCEIC
ncbi:zinc metalloproteinase nas-15-like isoform X2 [Mya arenaria]|uniref:zinc metalloproteinase nas-15-like isoform X2 n=1 Tax=Mya arenaria TaxID=6604 RepID=UPI0022E3826A|nr:zinc metalloproteinase nas-15-like isoform X2 [Mya arenaria]